MNTQEILESTTLKKGAHAKREDGMCAMEMVAYLAHEPHSDSPACTSPVLATFVRRLNDGWANGERQLLKPFLIKLIGTNDPAKEALRAEMLVFATITKIVPLAFDVIGLKEHAEKMRTVKFGQWKEARTICQEAERAAYAAAYAAYAVAADATDAMRQQIMQATLAALGEAINV